MIGHWQDSKDPDGDPIKVRVIELSEGSWFGDYQILFNMVSNWDLVAQKTKKKRNSLKKLRIPYNKVLVYKIAATRFL